MISYDNNYEFLNEITPKHLSNVKANFQFKFNNYTSLYVVDTYDIIEYCFPFLFNQSFKYDSQKAIINFLSYQLFYFEQKDRPVIMDEYRVELFSFWYRLQRKINEFSNYENLKDELIKKYHASKSEGEKIVFIQSNIGILLSLAFGTLSKTPVERYNKLLNDRLQNENIEVKDKEDQLIIEDIFWETRPDAQRVDEVFEKFCEQIKYRLIGKSDEEKYVYLESTLRDIKVYDRIVNINKKLAVAFSEGLLRNKYNFFYLSSAPTKSDIIEQFYLDTLPKHRDIDSETILRTNIETYLFQLLDIGDEPDQISLTINLLKKLENASSSYSNNASKIRQYKELFYDNSPGNKQDMLQKKYGLDEIFLRYHSVAHFQSKINAAIERLHSTGSDAELFQQFTMILDVLSNDASISALKQLETSFDQFNETMDMKREIITDIDTLKSYRTANINHVFPGKDYIRSLVQSFPVLLFYNKKNAQQIQSLFTQLILPGDHKDLVKEFIKVPHQVIQQYSTPEKKLFFLFVRYLFDKSIDEDFLIKEIDTLIRLNSKLKLQYYHSEERLRALYQPNQTFEVELIYFKTWMLRRDNRHDEAIEQLSSLLEQDTTKDPRLFQSRALCFKNKFYSEVDLQSSKELERYLLSALDDFERSEQGFFDLKRTNNTNDLLFLNLVAISNSIVDSISKLYLINPQIYSDYLRTARIRLDKLKSQVLEGGYAYDRYHAFGHTEVDLEYCEAVMAYQKGDTGLSKHKIKEANTRIERIEFSSSLRNYEPFEKTKRNVRRFFRHLFPH